MFKNKVDKKHRTLFSKVIVKRIMLAGYRSIQLRQPRFLDECPSQTRIVAFT